MCDLLGLISIEWIFYLGLLPLILYRRHLILYQIALQTIKVLV